MALAIAGELRTVRDAIEMREDELRRIGRELDRTRDAGDALPRPRTAAAFLDAQLADWKATLHRHPIQARQMIRRLLRARLVFTTEEQHEQPGYRVRGSFTPEPPFVAVLKGANGNGELRHLTKVHTLWRPQRPPVGTKSPAGSSRSTTCARRPEYLPVSLPSRTVAA